MTVDINVKEKLELWLISNPLVYALGALIAVIG